MIILNLGCGTKTSPSQCVINIDFSWYLRIKKNALLKRIAPIFLRGVRLERFQSLPINLMFHNLLNKLPFHSDSVDVVYLSHTLEHFDRKHVEAVLSNLKDILKMNGFIRISVPDFEKLCKDYLNNISIIEHHPELAEFHDNFISAIIAQSVRKEAYGTGEQKVFHKFVENRILGDARKRRQTHQWMYDRISLRELLKKIGFKNIGVKTYDTSAIPNWNSLRLDVNDLNQEYKPGSLYIEAQK
ncbi:hypothetical protein A2V80_03105 [Candidatus Woesebacteria bacterium RBG_16_39_8b]|uniref:Methyltransferase type 11 domain-containing protein n=1 Tax=Candidatus Woesebacteria bacterium RBG_16_39_8b TaxID=1802482 RepID=A0A1F7XC76_9BACT|nr:MAG: hypothetical protein A2V80_03105 [Candidatus Woesebacteria bacterium RBG_16_39_8b]